MRARDGIYIVELRGEGPIEEDAGQGEVVFNHTLMQPGTLTLALSALGPVLADHYTLTVDLVPRTLEEPWEFQGEAGQVGSAPGPAGVQVPSVMFSSCGNFINSVRMPIHSPAVVQINLTYESQYSTGRFRISDALGAVATELPANTGLNYLGFLAAPTYAYGDWTMAAISDAVGANVDLGTRFGANVTARSLPADAVDVPASVIPSTVLLADPRGDITETNFDILDAWISDDTRDALATHLRVDEIPAEGPPEGERWRYEVSWVYGGSTFRVFADLAEGHARFFASQDSGEALRVAAIPGRLSPGAPSTLSALVPKVFVGSPAPGKPLEGIEARTYRENVSATADAERAAFRGVPPPEGLPGGAEVRDATVTPASYLVNPASAPAPEVATPPAPAAPSGLAWWWLLLALPVGMAGVLAVRNRRSSRKPAGGRRFEVEREIGEGSFGRAVLARDTLLERRVVLKQPLGWQLQGEARRRFLREARIAAQVQHPNVVTLHEVLDEDPPTLVLEFVPGGSIDDLLRTLKRTPPAQAAAIILDVLKGLDAIHEAGIVHRDLKPSNVLLDAKGAAKITDFGVARPPAQLALTATLSSTTTQPGSVAYMSPEQARGGEVDARTDLYAAGVLLYRLLAGRNYLDFEGHTPVTARQLLLDGVPRLPAAEIPPKLERVLRRALAKDPADRFRSATEMADAVRDAAA